MRKNKILILIIFLFLLSGGIFYAANQWGISLNASSNYEGSRDGRVFYEIFVRSFYDSNGDGIGDLNGITEKLDYIKSLGVNGIWLSPIYKSPSYHGYDVTDYEGINPQFGTIEDFQKLTKEAHKRDIKVIIDFVPNHTSSMHPWFIEANKDKESKYRDYYIWADSSTNLDEISDIGSKAWHTKGNGYYYGAFYSEMPDLNYDNKDVREEIENSALWWMDKGVDGFRIDAAMHIYEKKRTEDTLSWWKEFTGKLEDKNHNVYLVGEVWSDQNTIAPYFNILDSCFNFRVGEDILKSVKEENANAARRAMKTVYRTYYREAPDFLDAPFLTNHDTERVMSIVDNEIMAKEAAAIYLTLPGNPFIYYGEEIGMKGKKPDEYIREPFKWYKKSGEGQTSWEKMRYNVGKDSVSVEEEENDSESLLNFYRDMIKFRLSNDVIIKGDISMVDAGSSILAYYRTYNEKIKFNTS